MDYQKRIEKVREHLSGKKFPVLVVTGMPNIFYLTGLLGIEGILIVSMKEICFAVPDLYYEQAVDIFARLETKPDDLNILKYKRRGFRRLVSGFRKIAFIDSDVSYAGLCRFRKAAEGKFFPVSDFIKQLRAIKEDEEIERMHKALRIAKKVMRHVRSQIKEGITELDIAAEIAYRTRLFGGKSEAFPTIVASGMHSAYPHHLPGKRAIKKDEPVVVDLGVDFEGYKSDITETFFIGRLPDELNFVYKTVSNVQKQCVCFAKEGKSASDVYRFAVEMLEREKLAKYFIHGLGHGVGIEVHEEPVLSRKSTSVLKKNMVFSIEPGVYIPGTGGVRLERMLFLT